jgi:hypothetical protein
MLHTYYTISETEFFLGTVMLLNSLSLTERKQARRA